MKDFFCSLLVEAIESSLLPPPPDQKKLFLCPSLPPRIVIFINKNYDLLKSKLIRIKLKRERFKLNFTFQH